MRCDAMRTSHGILGPPVSASFRCSGPKKANELWDSGSRSPTGVTPRGKRAPKALLPCKPLEQPKRIAVPGGGGRHGTARAFSPGRLVQSDRHGLLLPASCGEARRFAAAEDDKYPTAVASFGEVALLGPRHEMFSS